MRLLLLVLSICFITYGFFPYRKAFDIDTTKPDQLVISPQECGCPCPDAVIRSGHIHIPQYIISRGALIDTTEVNLDIENFNEPYNYELGHARLFITGEVVGVDTMTCDPSGCELTPRFKVSHWALADNLANVWTFPLWAFVLFLMNLFLFAPALLIAEIVIRIRNRKRN